MYKAYLENAGVAGDDLLFLDPKHGLSMVEAEIRMEDNAAGDFSLVVPPDNPIFSLLEESALAVNVHFFWDDGTTEEPIFSGRITSIQNNFDTTKTVEGRGLLSLLERTIQPQAEYHSADVEAFLRSVLANHNSQVNATGATSDSILIGNIDVETGVVYRFTDYDTTWKTIVEDVLDNYGGHMRVRYDPAYNGKLMLDYYPDALRTISQSIEFGSNLLDYTDLTDLGEIVTAVTPLGKNLTVESDHQGATPRTTIASVNGGKNYIFDPDMVAEYGFINNTVIFDEITDPATLKAKGQKTLDSSKLAKTTITLSALDLADFGLADEHIRLLDKVRCKSAAHGLDADFLVTEAKIDLLDPTKNEYTLGTKSASFVSSTRSALAAATAAGASFQVGDGTISADKLASGSVTTEKLAAQAVTSDKIADASVSADKLASGLLGATATATISGEAVGLGDITFRRVGFTVQASVAGETDFPLASSTTLDDVLPAEFRPPAETHLLMIFDDGIRASMAILPDGTVSVSPIEPVPTGSYTDFIGVYLV